MAKTWNPNLKLRNTALRGIGWHWRPPSPGDGYSSKRIFGLAPEAEAGSQITDVVMN